MAAGCVGVCVCARTRLRSVSEDSRNVILAVVFVIVSEGLEYLAKLISFSSVVILTTAQVH